ncbi:hypothetical protein CEK64_06610 [Xanthomonas sontii]|nr:hypothetical protein CEK64_06610 [Xanthomonas sontii]KAB7776263.1 hypothetical protein CEK65_13990 [Xanthomonas sp. LMG 12459]MCW0375475.1 hypothetical protein [Xanthomonas sacchari]MCW0386376.1 hypothetical protein [Xanthomonas sacchari]TYD36183.1 hypothetical protein CEK63_05960 [Xanthomonas sontii]
MNAAAGVRLAGMALAMALLGACATARGPAMVPTAVKAGQSWIVTRNSTATQVLDTCSRDSPARQDGAVTGYWIPTPEQIAQLEAHLAQLQPQIADPSASDRQYVGILYRGKQAIYVNAFAPDDSSERDPTVDAVKACGGGNRFWGAVYDPASARFSEIAVNGAR